MRDRWLSDGACSGAASLAFSSQSRYLTSLGVVLFTMAAELHWSFTGRRLQLRVSGPRLRPVEPAAALLMGRIGGRATICLGAIMLAIGFAICAVTRTMAEFYVAMLFIGIGLFPRRQHSGRVPDSSWFTRGSARVIGLYLMLGALGAAVGPTLVFKVVEHVGWRAQWQVMSRSRCVVRHQLRRGA